MTSSDDSSEHRILSGLAHLGLGNVGYNRTGIASASDVRMLLVMAELSVRDIIADPA